MGLFLSPAENPEQALSWTLAKKKGKSLATEPGTQ
jgi:hypothetical protein